MQKQTTCRQKGQIRVHDLGTVLPVPCMSRKWLSPCSILTARRLAWSRFCKVGQHPRTEVHLTGSLCRYPGNDLNHELSLDAENTGFRSGRSNKLLFSLPVPQAVRRDDTQRLPKHTTMAQLAGVAASSPRELWRDA